VTIDEFTEEIAIIEEGYRTISEPNLTNRRVGVFEQVEKFNVETFRQARKLLGSDVERRYFPSPNEFLAACQEVNREIGPENGTVVTRPNFKLTTHKCSPAPRHTGAWLLLRELRPLEAQHVTCSGGIPVCPTCGKRQQPATDEMIQALMAAFPDQTDGWVPTVKTWMVCTRCQAREAS
jgi:hypothetical protein